MRRHLLRTLFAIAPASATTITSVSPQGEVAKVRQITLKFSEAVLPFGDLRLPDPLSLSCQGAVPAGSGRWASDSVWLYDFRDALPPGTRCTLKASVTANAWCEVEGIGERITVRVVGGEPRAQLLKARRIDATQAARTLVLGCQRPLPNGAALRLGLFCAGAAGVGREGAADARVARIARVSQRARAGVRQGRHGDRHQRADLPHPAVRERRVHAEPARGFEGQRRSRARQCGELSAQACHRRGPADRQVRGSAVRGHRGR